MKLTVKRFKTLVWSHPKTFFFLSKNVHFLTVLVSLFRTFSFSALPFLFHLVTLRRLFLIITVGALFSNIKQFLLLLHRLVNVVFFIFLVDKKEKSSHIFVYISSLWVIGIDFSSLEYDFFISPLPRPSHQRKPNTSFYFFLIHCFLFISLSLIFNFNITLTFFLSFS